MNRRTIAGYSLIALLPVIANTANADTLDGTISVLKSKPYQTSTLNETQNSALFNKFCIGNANSAEPPQPNYNDPLVKAAAAKLSATKTVSSQRLFNSKLREIETHITNAKTQCATLAKDKDPAIATTAQELAKELEKTNPKEGFSPAAKALLEKVGSSYGTPLATVASALAQTLPNELKGIDFGLLSQYVDGLYTELAPTLKPVDFKVLTNTTNELATSLAGDVKPSDMNAIKAAVATLDSMLPASGDQQVVYVKQQIAYLKQVLSAPQQIDTYSIMYYIDNSVRYIENAVSKNALALSGEGDKALQILKEQIALLQSSNVLESVEQLKHKLATLHPESNSNDANDIMWEAQSLLGSVKALDSIVSAKTKTLIASFASEVVKFSSNEILRTFALFKQQMASGQSQEAMYTASNLIYSLRDLPATQKTETVVSLQAKLEAELTKSQTSGVLEMVKQFKAAADTAGGKLTDDMINFASSLPYSLQPLKGAVKPETAKAIDSLLAISSQLNTVSNLKNSMSVEAPAAVQSQHFYFYGAVNRIYLPSNDVPATAPQGTQAEAHQFLTQLCGEFRDRATMIHAKLKWASNIFILPTGKKTFSINVNKNVWAQVPASAYGPYISMTQQVWGAKRQKAARYITIGNNTQVDNPVPGFTVCETKYIFSEYVGKGKAFDGIDSYYAGYKTYREACTPDDRRDYYDFRGDSNFKHYSPESNGMIWYATTIARACKNTTTARPNQNGITDDDCRKYFTKPFFYRYNAARAGLAAWLFRDDKHADQFSSQGKMVAIYPHRTPELAPFSFSYNQTNATADVFEFDQNWLTVPGGWNQADIGFNAFTGLGSQQPDHVKAYQRIRDAVDRHTDWYNSGYNDKNGTTKDQAYSPFVASSYDPSASDGFTRCGPTVQCPDDGLKRWMFVFRVKPENWYTPARLLKNEPVNFDKMWFDETAFGDSGLANSEKAMDRLGTAYEGEFDSILYLVNVGQREE